MVERARALVSAEPNRHSATCQVVAGDSTCTDFRGLLAAHGARSAQLAILHPPYHDIIHFSDDPRDLSNSPSIEEFLRLMGRVVENVAPALERGRYLALVIGDKYARGEWSPLGFLTMNEVQQRGFLLKSIVVKNYRRHRRQAQPEGALALPRPGRRLLRLQARVHVPLQEEVAQPYAGHAAWSNFGSSSPERALIV